MSVLAPPTSASGTALQEVKAKGYAEFVRDGLLIVEGQRVRAYTGTRFKGDGIDSIASIPLGYEVEAKGPRQPDGAIWAREIKAKPNGDAMFESQVLQATNEIEQVWVRQGRMFESDAQGRERTIGRLVEEGPEARRVHEIMRRLVPPYVDYESQIRVHVVETEEWNAAAMGNGAIWVYTGLINDMSDDELAIVLGHELAHYSHEHSRRQAKSSMWQGLLGLGAVVAGELIEGGVARDVAMVTAGLGMTVWGSGYSRDLEDQADRVGLRYAHEGGYDVAAGPMLWAKFRARYGEADSVTNFFFGSHSRASDRIDNILEQIEVNYPERRSAVSTEVTYVPPRPEPEEPPAGSGGESEWVVEVRNQLARIRAQVPTGYMPAGKAAIDVLGANASTQFDLTLERGREYLIFGVCDSDCTDLDLVLYDAGGQQVVADFEPDDRPALSLLAPGNVTWTLQIRMPGCSTSECIFGVQHYSR